MKYTGWRQNDFNAQGYGTLILSLSLASGPSRSPQVYAARGPAHQRAQLAHQPLASGMACAVGAPGARSLFMLTSSMLEQ